MPKYSYETYEDLRKSSQQKKERKVGYFKLKDGEEALVRLVYSSPKEFEIATVHEVKIKESFRRVLCLRDAREPVEKCPLCASGSQVKARFFMKLIRYVVDEFGKVTGAFAEVANLPKKYSDTVNSLIVEYGDLKDQVFKIKRTGSDKDTTYTFMYANPVKYSEANGFVKDFSAFDDFDLAHHSYLEKTKEDMEEFLQTGEFPFNRKETTQDTPIGNNLEKLEVPEEDVNKVLGHPGVQQEEDDFVAPFSRPAQESTPTRMDGGQARPRRTYDWNN